MPSRLSFSIWPFVGVACANFLTIIWCWFGFRHFDRDEGKVTAIGTDLKIEGLIVLKKARDAEKVYIHNRSRKAL